MYGAGPSKISQQVTKDSGTYFSVSEAKEVIDDYFGSFHRLKKWIETNQNSLNKMVSFIRFWTQTTITKRI